MGTAPDPTVLAQGENDQVCRGPDHDNGKKQGNELRSPDPGRRMLNQTLQFSGFQVMVRVQLGNGFNGVFDMRRKDLRFDRHSSPI